MAEMFFSKSLNRLSKKQKTTQKTLNSSGTGVYFRAVGTAPCWRHTWQYKAHQLFTKRTRRQPTKTGGQACKQAEWRASTATPRRGGTVTIEITTAAWTQIMHAHALSHTHVHICTQHNPSAKHPSFFFCLFVFLLSSLPSIFTIFCQRKTANSSWQAHTRRRTVRAGQLGITRWGGGVGAFRRQDHSQCFSWLAEADGHWVPGAKLTGRLETGGAVSGQSPVSWLVLLSF